MRRCTGRQGTRGLLRLEDQALVLEFGERVTEIGEGVVDQQGTGVHEVRIPVGAVRELSYRHRWIRPSLLDIELARLGPAEAVPWLRGTRIRVRVPRGAGALARELGAEVELLQADARLRELGEGDLAG